MRPVRSLLTAVRRKTWAIERRLVRFLAARYAIRPPDLDAPSYAAGEDVRAPAGVPNRSGMISLAFEFMAGNVMQGDYFEFGCWGGRTFRMAYAHHKALFDGKMHFWLFDSFRGLPALNPADRHPKWQEGDYCTPREDFERIAAEAGIPPDRYTIVEGFYQDTLTPARAAELVASTRAGVVYIDCDLFESTALALEFVRPLLQQGTVLCFDDYYCFNGRPDKGEQRAIAEFLARHSEIAFVDYFHFGWHGRSFLVHLREDAGSR